MEIFKIVGVGLLTCVAGLVVKQIRPEFYVPIVLSGGVVILLMVVDELKIALGFFGEMFALGGLNAPLFRSVLKVLGVGYLTDFASSLCVDAGSSSIADKVVFAGKIIIFVLAMPIVKSLFDVILEMLP